MARVAITPGTRPVPVANDHPAWAEWWGLHCIQAMEARSPWPELDLEHAVRSARLAWWHACHVGNYKYWDPRKREVK